MGGTPVRRLTHIKSNRLNRGARPAFGLTVRRCPRRGRAYPRRPGLGVLRRFERQERAPNSGRRGGQHEL